MKKTFEGVFDLDCPGAAMETTTRRGPAMEAKAFVPAFSVLYGFQWNQQRPAAQIS